MPNHWHTHAHAQTCSEEKWCQSSWTDKLKWGSNNSSQSRVISNVNNLKWRLKRDRDRERRNERNVLFQLHTRVVEIDCSCRPGLRFIGCLRRNEANSWDQEAYLLAHAKRWMPSGAELQSSNQPTSQASCRSRQTLFRLPRLPSKAQLSSVQLAFEFNSRLLHLELGSDCTLAAESSRIRNGNGVWSVTFIIAKLITLGVSRTEPMVALSSAFVC